MTSSNSETGLPPDLIGIDFGIVVVSDIACPWAHVAMRRLADARERLGIDVELPVDHRVFPLELVNGRPTPKEILEREIRVCRDLEPNSGWAEPRNPWSFPVSTLPALEAVQAAKSQGSEVSVALDLRLRQEMFVSWRCISIFPVVFDIAAEVDGLDVERLRDDIVGGQARAELWRDVSDLVPNVPGSPTFVLPDGSITHNPGIELGDADDGAPTVEHHDPGAIAALVNRALALRRFD